MEKYQKALELIEEIADWLNGTREACGDDADNEKRHRAMINHAINEGTHRLQSVKDYLSTDLLPEWYESEEDLEE